MMLCLVMAVSTVAAGYPAFGSEGCALEEDEDGYALLLFVPCAASELEVGDRVVLRSVRGIATGEVLSLSSGRIAVGTKGGATSYPDAALLGKVRVSRRAAGRVLGYAAEHATVLSVTGIAVAVLAGISLITGIRKEGQFPSP